MPKIKNKKIIISKIAVLGRQLLTIQIFIVTLKTITTMECKVFSIIMNFQSD